MFGNQENYISDPAYCIRFLEQYQQINRLKNYKISIMPYYRTMRVFPWERFCEKHGYNLITPFRDEDIETKIEKISQSECLISEAMHGAIAADALRVPWVRLQILFQF